MSCWDIVVSFLLWLKMWICYQTMTFSVHWVCIPDKCEARKMEVSSSRAEITIFDWKKVEFFLLVGSESPPQVKEFRYFGVWFRSDGKMERKLDRWMRSSSHY